MARGEITPDEGAARLDFVDASPAAVAATTAPPAGHPAGATLRRVKVSTQIGTAEVVGDPSVAFAVAEGAHSARQEGDMMVIEQRPFEGSDTFTFGHPGNPRGPRRNLIVRMNPDLELITDVQAGSVRVDGVHGPIKSEVQAGNFSIEDFRGPLDLSVQAGNVIASGRLETGESRIHCEMGSVAIRLEKGSSVRIGARTQLGKLVLEGAGAQTSASGSDKRLTVGAGAASLDINCEMGNVRVTVD